MRTAAVGSRAARVGHTLMYMIPWYDYYAVWSGGRAFLEGRDAYDRSVVFALLGEHGIEVREDIGGFYYPPWTLWWLCPWSALPFELAGWVVTLVNLAVLFLALLLLLQPGFLRTWLPPPRSPSTGPTFRLLLLVVLVYFPLHKLLFVGQLATIGMLGVCGALLGYHLRSHIMMGLFLSLLLIKPQSGAIFLLGCVLSSAQPWRLALAIALGGGTQLLMSMLIHVPSPADWANWWALLSQRRDYPEATMGHVLNVWTGATLWPRGLFLTAAVAVAAAARRWRFNLRQLVLLALPTSLLFAPAGWSHDHILLLPAVLWWAVWFAERNPPLLARLLFIQLFAGILAMALGPGRFEIALVWLPAALFVAGLWYEFRLARRSPQAASDGTMTG